MYSDLLTYRTPAVAPNGSLPTTWEFERWIWLQRVPKTPSLAFQANCFCCFICVANHFEQQAYIGDVNLQVLPVKTPAKYRKYSCTLEGESIF